jgi:hypothetical protein
MARVRALLRRTGQGSPGPFRFSDGGLDLDLLDRVWGAGYEGDVDVLPTEEYALAPGVMRNREGRRPNHEA